MALTGTTELWAALLSEQPGGESPTVAAAEKFWLRGIVSDGLRERARKAWRAAHAGADGAAAADHDTFVATCAGFAEAEGKPALLGPRPKVWRGDERDPRAKQAQDLDRKCRAILEGSVSAKAGFLLPGSATTGLRALVECAQPHVASTAKAEKRAYLSTFEADSVKPGRGFGRAGAFPAELPPRTKLASPSPSGRFLAVFRDAAPGEGKPEDKAKGAAVPGAATVVLDTASAAAVAGGATAGGAKPAARVEVWNGARLVHYVDVPGSVHGKVYADGGWFAGCDWSADERSLVYCAEAPPPTRAERLARGGDPCAPDAAEAAFDFSEDWGEGYDGLRRPALFVLSFACAADGTAAAAAAGTPRRVRGIPGDVSAGQPQFAPGGQEVVFAGWLHGDRQLGMIYCYQRPCGVYVARVPPVPPPPPPVEGGSPPPLSSAEAEGGGGGDGDGDEAEAPPAVLLTEGHATARFPRFSPDGTRLAFLATDAEVTHNACSRLCLFDWARFRMISFPEEYWRAREDAKAMFPWEVCDDDEDDEGDSDGDDPMSSLSRVLVDVVDEPSVGTAWGTFPGLFVNTVPRRCWVGNDMIVLNSVWRSSLAVVRVNIVSLEDDSTHGFSVPEPITWGTNRCLSEAHRVLDVVGVRELGLKIICGGGVALVEKSTPCGPPTLGLAVVSTGAFLSSGKGWWEALHGGETGVWMPDRDADAWRAHHPVLASAVDGVEPPRVLSVAPPPPRPGAPEPAAPLGPPTAAPFEAVLLLPKARHSAPWPVPLVVVPHGGPHSAFAGHFHARNALLCGHLRMALLLVNYRGSTGFGRASLRSLPGRIGAQDVDDCLAALAAALAAAPSRVDGTRVAVVGGSHGGFLTAHLLGQRPGRFRCAVTRNPACNLASMAGATDIPDWCFVEAGRGGWAPAGGAAPRIATAADLAAMDAVSPVRYADAVVAPTLFLLGLRDRRCPPAAGLQLFHRLRARGVFARLRAYAGDRHAIAGAGHADFILQTGLWLLRFL